MFFLGSCLPVTEYSGILTSLHFFPTWVLFKAVLWGSGSSSGEGNGNPLQYSCLENAMDRGAWQATVHGITRVGHDLALSLSFAPKLPVVLADQSCTGLRLIQYSDLRCSLNSFSAYLPASAPFPLLHSFFFFSFFFILAAWHVVSYLSSWTRDGTCAPCFGSLESQPLDYQGSPSPSFFIGISHNEFL